MTSGEAILRRREEPLTAELDDEIVMLDPEKGSYYSLGIVGSRVWDLLSSPSSVGAICQRLVTEFDIDEWTCRSQVDDFVDQLLEADLVERVET
jgi:Coenzyme PQQ synthesis protein D (PqqD)